MHMHTFTPSYAIKDLAKAEITSNSPLMTELSGEEEGKKS